MDKKIVLLGYIWVLLLLCVGICFQFVKPARAATTWTVDDDGPADFDTIDEAVDTANNGDTILVAAGTYRPGSVYQILQIEKSLTLLGADPNTTVIEGIILIYAHNVRISGFTVGANPPAHPGARFYVSAPLYAEGDNGVLDSNIFLGNGYYFFQHPWDHPYRLSVQIHGSGWLVSSNHILPLEFQYIDKARYYFGLVATGANNTVVGNTIGDISHPTGRIAVIANDNTIYHNNFYGSEDHFQTPPPNFNNTWDNGYPDGGNYWHNYTGVDDNHGSNQDISGSDGIGDTPYAIYANNKDNYPLMNPWTPTETSVKVKGTDHPVTIVSNTTIEHIVATKNTLHFKSSGPTGEIGYILVIFPMVNTTEIKVFIDGEKLTPPPFPVINTNSTHYFIYFEFTLSTHTITIQFATTVPVGGFWVSINKFELLAPWIGLASLITVATVSVVYVKHRKKKEE